MTGVHTPGAPPGSEVGPGTVRALGADDLPAAVGVLTSRPVENVFVASRVRLGGLEPFTLGCPVWGYEVEGHLVALCHAGANLVPVNADDPVIWDAFAAFAGPRRTSSSIFGPAAATLGLWQRLQQRWGAAWTGPRDVREHQPLMAIATDPAVPPHPGVRPVTMAEWDSYFTAAVRMYTEEVGVSPIAGGSSGYAHYVRQLINGGRAFALVEDGQVIFKADVGSVAGNACQVQGVWVDPAYRGRGLAPRCMAAVVGYARRQVATVSLYVNDFNAPALATYRRAGFVQVGEFATVLF